MAEAKDQDNKQDETPIGTPVVRNIGRDFRVEGNDVDGYIGVDPEYRTYASDTHKPYTTDEDVKNFTDHGLLTDVEKDTIAIADVKVRSGAVVLDDEGNRVDPDDEDDSDDSDGGPDRIQKPKLGAASTPAKSTSAKAPTDNK